MAGIPIGDASGYATQAGFVGPGGRWISRDGQPVPRFSPAPLPPAPLTTGTNAAAPQLLRRRLLARRGAKSKFAIATANVDRERGSASMSIVE